MLFTPPTTPLARLRLPAPLLPVLVLAAATAAAAACHLDADGLASIVVPGAPAPGDGQLPPPPSGTKWADAGQAPASRDAAGEPPDPSVTAADAGGGAGEGTPPGQVQDGAAARADARPRQGATADAAGDDPPAPAPSPDGAGAPPSACASLAPLPLGFTTRAGVPSSEDITFDPAGYLITFDRGDLVRIGARGSMVVIRNVVDRNSDVVAVRPLPAGDFLIGDYEREEIVRVAPGGSRRRLTTLARPSRMIRGPGGMFYLSGFGGVVVRLDADSGAVSTVAKVGFRSSGIGFSPDYGTIYVSDLDSGSLYRARVRPDGSLDPLQVWLRFPSDSLDGMVTDQCGNLYITSYTDEVLLRATPAGRIETAARLNASVSTVVFGVAGQGFDDRSLYLNNLDRGGVFELRLGVGAPPPPP